MLALATAMGLSPSVGFLGFLFLAASCPESYPFLSGLPPELLTTLQVVAMVLALLFLLGSTNRFGLNFFASIEDQLGAIVVAVLPFVVFFTSSATTGTASPAEPALASISLFSYSSFLIVMTVGAFVVVASVRYAFTLIASLFSPLPFMSGWILLLKNGGTVAFILLYYFFPHIATVVNIITVFMAFLLFRWASGWIYYGTDVLIEPLKRKMKRFISRKKHPYLPLSATVPKSLSDRRIPLLSLPVIVLKHPSLPTRKRAILLSWEDHRLYLVVRRWLRKPLVAECREIGQYRELGHSFLQLELRWKSETGEAVRIALSGGYRSLETLPRLLGVSEFQSWGMRGSVRHLKKVFS